MCIESLKGGCSGLVSGSCLAIIIKSHTLHVLSTLNLKFLGLCCKNKLLCAARQVFLASKDS